MIDNATINSRIAEFISLDGLKRVDVSRALHVSDSYITQICKGSSMPSNRTITDLCRIYGLSETWLRTGEGEMRAPVSRSEELGSLVKSLMSERPESFRSALITALLKFDPSGEEWKVLEKIFLGIMSEHKNTPEE